VTHAILTTYLRMALGLPMPYDLETMQDDFYHIFAREPLCDCWYIPEQAMFDYAWADDDTVDRICEAKGVTRERFIKSFAAPKPSLVAHLIYMDELQRRFGCTANLPKRWDSGRGLIIPKKENDEIVKIEFHRLSQLLKPRLTRRGLTA
jgi:hypothetical protein